ncbi:putative ankyrin repeat domain-containing protein 12 [Apostichopus japonicus]|uniref:Putative ankyrin repeat domain-containing protein 12 n=1 Tax=Stichopus japonicus TaxID=307972 RepID=A0A2G8KIB1_STIJA|nr:putative ankyrin repeat domain-containing protein 12 [Apostichopus japonicus]
MADQSPQQQPPEKESPSPSKSATTPTKGDKTLKRKLFPSGTPEDADKKTPKVTPKRKKTTSQPGSPTLLGTPGRSIPLSERQQLALLMQMTAEESPTPGPAKESPVAKPTGSKSKVNNQNNRGETSLHLAAIKGDIQVAESLINQGADVNAQDYAGWTALHEACNHGHSELTDLLLTAGAFVNALGSDDYTPLHDAAVNGHREDGRTPEGLVLDERATTEKKKEPIIETEAAAEIIKENTPAPSSEDPYEFTQDNSNEQKITIHWASPDKTGKNSYMEITRTIPKAREQSTPVSFLISSTSDSDLLDPQLNPIMTKALDDIKGESPIKPIPQETSPVACQQTAR